MLANVQTAAEASGKTELLAGVEITAIAAPAVASSAPAAARAEHCLRALCEGRWGRF